MKASRDATIFIDLSFLSPEEETIIQKVLLRDEDLKKHELGRVRKLRDSVPDPKQLKVLSGEWFEDLKSKRYGRQPHVSAVVRSSMRWKKSAGHKPNPFLKAVPEDKNEEKNKTRPDVSTDPRSIHPALSVQVQQENKDEAIVLEESPGAKLNTPVLEVIEVGHQTGPKLQNQTSLTQSQKLEPMQESKTKAIITNEINTNMSDPGRTTLKEDRRVETTSLETRPKRTDGNTSRNFEIRSFSQAQETMNWEMHQIDDESNNPQSKVEIVQIRTETEKTDKQNNPRPEVLMNAGFGFKEEIQASIPNRRSGEEIRVMSITNKRITPTKTEELSIDLNTKDDPVYNVNAPVHIHSDQKSLDPVQKRKDRAVEEIIVADFKQRAPTRMEELSVEKDSDILEGPVNSVNTSKHANLDQSLDPVLKGEERGVEEIIIADSKQRSLSRKEELGVEVDLDKSPDILKGPVNNVNMPKHDKLDQSLSPVSKRKEMVVQEITVSDFKQRSIKRVEELSVDLDVETDPDILEGPINNANTPKHANLDQSLSPVAKRKDRAVQEIIINDFKQRSPKRVEEVSVDVDLDKDPNIFEGPVNNVNTPKRANLDQILSPVPKRKEIVVQEIIVSDLKQRSPSRMEDLSVNLDVEKDPDILEGPVNNVNTPKHANLDESLSPVPRRKEMVVQEIKISDFKQRSPKRVEELNVDLHVEKDPDIFEGPDNNVKTAKYPKILSPVPKRRVRAVEEYIVTDFKQSPPTRTEELSVDLNVEANLDIVEDLKAGPVHKDIHKDEIGLADMNRDELPELVMKNKKNEATRGKKEVDLRMSEGTNQKVSKEMEEIAEREPEGSFRDREDESGISESNILTNVYARATRPKSGVSKTPLAQDPLQTTVDVIPSIVIVPSETEELKEMEGVKNETPAPEALVELKPGTEIWEDETLDSDEDSSSTSSHDSDLSGKKGQLSATSTLSVTERTASLLSVYSDAGDFGNVSVQGAVEFAIMYSPLGELVIMVEQCQDLAIANPRKQRTDPYVKTYLYPDKRSKRKTSIKKRTVNPVYVESLRYKVKHEELHGKTLNLSVWHNDSRGRNAFLGQVEINLKEWDWKHEALTWYNLQPKNVDNQESQEYRGILCVSLKFVPPEATGGSRLSRPTGEIHIWLREARHLRRLKAQGVDSFVKCYMLPDTSKKSRQKTRVVKKTQDPVYNHNMVYDGFRAGEVSEACCELTVWDNNKLSNQFLGGVRLSLGTGQSYGRKVDWMDSENEEVEIWKKMIDDPNSWVEAELPLRSSMTPRQ